MKLYDKTSDPHVPNAPRTITEPVFSVPTQTAVDETILFLESKALAAEVEAARIRTIVANLRRETRSA